MPKFETIPDKGNNTNISNINQFIFVRSLCITYMYVFVQTAPFVGPKKSISEGR